MHTVLHLANNKLCFAIIWDWGGVKFHELAMDWCAIAFILLFRMFIIVEPTVQLYCNLGQYIFIIGLLKC